MVLSVVERILELIERYENMSPITDRIVETKDKQGGIKTIIEKASLAELLNTRNKNNKVSVDVCYDEYIKPEKKKLARYIFENTKIYIDEKGTTEQKADFKKYDYREGFENHLSKFPDHIVYFCKNAVIQTDKTLLVPIEVLEPLMVDNVELGMKLKPKEELTDKEKRMREKW